MAKTYFIPHNYNNSGRVFNMFYKKDLTIAFCIGIPLALLIFNLPFSFANKCAVFLVLAVPPMLAFLLGYGSWIINLINFYNNRKIYYKFKGGETEALNFAYKVYTSPKEKLGKWHKKTPSKKIANRL